MILNRVNSAINRNERNKINENFDILERGYGKAFQDSQLAKDQSTYAVETSDEAKQKAESTQIQLDTIVIEGDSSVEAAQARVSADATVYDTLKARLDAEKEQVNQQLAQTVGAIITPAMFGAKGDGSDDTAAIQNAFEALKSPLFSTLDFQGKTYYINSEISWGTMWDREIINGSLKALETFTGEYLIRSVSDGDLRPQSGGHHKEDITLNRITLDGSFVASGLYLNDYLRVTINDCKFNRYKKYGINLNYGHEVNLSDSYFRYVFQGETNDKTSTSGITAINLTNLANDNYLDNVVTVGGYAGINVGGKYNFFNNVHSYGCHYYAIINATHNTISNGYADGCLMRVNNPWSFIGTNIRFLGGANMSNDFTDSDIAFIEFNNTGTSTVTMKGVILNNIQIELQNQTTTGKTFRVLKVTGLFTNSYYQTIDFSNISVYGNVINNVRDNYKSTINLSSLNVSSQNPLFNSEVYSPTTELAFGIDSSTGMGFGTSGGYGEGGKFIFDHRWNYQSNYPIAMTMQFTNNGGATRTPPADKFRFYKNGDFQPLGTYRANDGASGTSGTFTSNDGKTVIVKNGIIVGIN